MNKAIAIISLLFLVGCGEAHSSTEPTVNVEVDPSTVEWLRLVFDEVKACTKIKEGSFENLDIRFMPLLFPCKHYPEGCFGEFVTPSLIKIGYLPNFRHEVVHFLLYWKYGDPDPRHTNQLFQTCGVG